MTIVQQITLFIHSPACLAMLVFIIALEQYLASNPNIAANSTFQVIARATQGAKNALFPAQSVAATQAPTQAQ